MKKNTALMPGRNNNNLKLFQNEEQDTKTILKHSYKPSCTPYGVRSVNVTHDNKYLIITYLSNHGYIRVIDLEKLEILPCRYTGHQNSVRMVVVEKNNRYFFTASWDGTYRRFDLLKGTYDLRLGVTGRSPSCCLDDETHLLTASYDSDISLSGNNTGRRWNLSTGEVVTFYRHFKPRKDPECIDIVCDGDFIYSGSDDGMGIKWDKKTGKILLTYIECDANIRKIFISDRFYAASATDGIIRVHDEVSGAWIRDFFHSYDEAMDVRISKDETRLFSGSMDGSIKCFSLVTGEELYHKKFFDQWIWSLKLAFNDEVLISGSSDGSVVFVSSETGQLLAQLHCFPVENEVLFECPPDKAFPQGFFYTSNKDFIEVVKEDMESGTTRVLDLKDPERTSYIDRLNLRNLVITRLTNNRQYNTMTEKHLNDRKLLGQIPNLNLPKRLRS